jgi:hypothetical protein
MRGAATVPPPVLPATSRPFARPAGRAAIGNPGRPRRGRFGSRLHTLLRELGKSCLRSSAVGNSGPAGRIQSRSRPVAQSPSRPVAQSPSRPVAQWSSGVGVAESVKGTHRSRLRVAAVFIGELDPGTDPPPFDGPSLAAPRGKSTAAATGFYRPPGGIGSAGSRPGDVHPEIGPRVAPGSRRAASPLPAVGKGAGTRGQDSGGAGKTSSRAWAKCRPSASPAAWNAERRLRDPNASATTEGAP